MDIIHRPCTKPEKADRNLDVTIGRNTGEVGFERNFNYIFAGILLITIGFVVLLVMAESIPASQKKLASLLNAIGVFLICVGGVVFVAGIAPVVVENWD